MFNRIAILAPGLLGASLAKAVRERSLAGHISIWARRAEIRATCLADGIADSVHSEPAEAVTGADLVVLCAPVARLAELAALCVHGLKPGCIVTDVGSTKSKVCSNCTEVMPEGVTFIGSHPMAGSEKSGMEYADAHLFANRTVIVTPTGQPCTAQLKLEAFWRAIGMNVVTLDPETHDRAVAHISHLPHFLASALAAHLAQMPDNWASLCGNGLRDTTRIAAGSPTLWKEIFQENKSELLAAIRTFSQQLAQMELVVESENFDQLERILHSAKQYRDRLNAANPNQSHH
ncbi:MAG: prephenate dehydrogenase/arogenate dehydrogenase family protein [Verrucomicrobia bacterium]|nr:prephenate dehydrogenase/arogenate dehydrogenase family protein [Verrucomicrobiota bacterium]